VIANRAGIAPFGGELAHKGFALALVVELLAAALAPVDGHAACVLLARPRSQPAEAMRRALEGRRFPGDAGAETARRALSRGTLELDDELWAWLSTTPGR